MEDDTKAYIQLFPSGHIPTVLACIFEAGRTLRKKTETDREDWITRRLYCRLVQLPTFRDGPLCIHLKPEIVDPKLDANTPSGEIDLLVSCRQGYEVYFPLEAKGCA